ncbi:MAG: MarR family transcriptional regulator [Phycisphaerales bacterium]
MRVENLVRRLAEPHFARMGISGAQWGILRSLTRLEDAGNPRPRMRELGAALIVQPPSLSATLSRMEHAGLIARKSDPADQRTRRIAITQTGRALLARELPTHRAFADRLMAGLTSRERHTLRSLIDKLSTHLDHQANPPRPTSSKNGHRSPS